MVVITDGIVARLLDWGGGGGVGSSGGPEGAALTLLLLQLLPLREGQRNHWDYRFPKRLAAAAYACLACSPAWRSHGGSREKFVDVPVPGRTRSWRDEKARVKRWIRKEGRGGKVRREVSGN